MVLWVDKYRPKTLESMDYHTDLSAQLQRLISVGADLPHMLVYGPSGAGKKTRVMALLREMHGASVERVRVETRTFKVNSTSVELTLLSSAHHIELNPSDAGNRDREVVQEVIKEIAQTAPVLVSASEDGVAAVRGFKVVILNEVERLSKPAQHALRRTMEKHVGTCRLLLLCTNPCKVIAPIRSRCMCVRVSAPTHQEVARVLAGVASKEGFKLPEALALRISKASERNLRRAVLTLEACKVAQSPLSESQPIQLPDWQLFIGAIAEEIVKEQSPKQLLKVRGKLYELLSNCIPAETVMHYLVQSLLRRVPLAVRHETLHHAAIYEHRLQTGQKAIFHLEAFVARFMAVYKKHQLAGGR